MQNRHDYREDVLFCHVISLKVGWILFQALRYPYFNVGQHLGPKVTHKEAMVKLYEEKKFGNLPPPAIYAQQSDEKIDNKKVSPVSVPPKRPNKEHGQVAPKAQKHDQNISVLPKQGSDIFAAKETSKDDKKFNANGAKQPVKNAKPTPSIEDTINDLAFDLGLDLDSRIDSKQSMASGPKPNATLARNKDPGVSKKNEFKYSPDKKDMSLDDLLSSEVFTYKPSNQNIGKRAQVGPGVKNQSPVKQTPTNVESSARGHRTFHSLRKEPKTTASPSAAFKTAGEGVVDDDFLMDDLEFTLPKGSPKRGSGRTRVNVQFPKRNQDIFSKSGNMNNNAILPNLYSNETVAGKPSRINYGSFSQHKIDNSIHPFTRVQHLGAGRRPLGQLNPSEGKISQGSTEKDVSHTLLGDKNEFSRTLRPIPGVYNKTIDR